MDWRKNLGEFVDGFANAFRWKKKEIAYDPDHFVGQMWMNRAKLIVHDIIRMEHDPVWVRDAIDLRNYAEAALEERDADKFNGAIRAIDTRMQQTVERNRARFKQINAAFVAKAKELIDNTLDTERTALAITKIARNVNEELKKGQEEGVDPCIIMQVGLEQLEAL